ncbi:6-phosphogluconolactonase [Oceanicella sp. SM1341]|uniref:6-phosphogluconolactonase n=1 Tax=Oceanicella sp. SM1341 TaxID=1548889 RepID=UPI0021084D4A|nr:6-phosphogluconolactonase [Oceanicella sp. SM1341]
MSPAGPREDFPDRVTLMAALAGRVAGLLAEAIAARGRATLAVPGGTTPGPFLELLSETDLDWSRVSVMLTDERFVPESSERSNTALLRRTLLKGRAAAATLVPLTAEGESPEAVLPGLAEAVRAALPLDVCVLGMGADMHTASIFPGADKLAEALAPDAPELLPMRAPGAPEPRITLTAPVLSSARHIFVLLTGAEKAEALARALTPGPTEEAPVRAVLSHGATVVYAP